MEHWKSVNNYEGLYEVSNLGQIKSLQRTDNRGKTVNERILKPCTDKWVICWLICLMTVKALKC